MTVSNTVCAVEGCGEAQEHLMHHGRDKLHDFAAGLPPGHPFLANYGSLPGCWWCGQPEGAIVHGQSLQRVMAGLPR
jgi:hypothetical protein